MPLRQGYQLERMERSKGKELSGKPYFCSMKQDWISILLKFSTILVLASCLFSFSSSKASDVSSLQKDLQRQLILGGQGASILNTGDSKRAEQEVEKLLAKMTLDEQVGQLLMPVVYPSEEARALKTAKQLLSKVHPGGLLFQKGSAHAQYNMTHTLNAESRLPLLITADAEWGLAMRLSGTMRYPRNMGLSHCSSSLLQDYGRDMARQCKIVGIHANFAPVLDVNNNPSNPVIGTRSFAEDVATVSRLGLAYAKGLEEGGVLSVAKHFPGHGNTRLDSHKTLPTIKGSKTSLEATELAPFKAYISAGYGGIMTGHLSVPALDRSNTPASLSHAITTRLLQGEMHFGGLIFTDALAMEGAKRKSSLSLGVQALLAGNDILLAPKDPIAMHAQIVAAVREGKLSKELIHERCKKVILAKWHLMGGSLEKPTSGKSLEEIDLYAELNTQKACNLADELWIASIYIDGENEKLQTISTSKRIGLLEINGGTGGGAKNAFRATMHEMGKAPAAHRAIERENGVGNIAALEKAFAQCDLILINCYNDKGAFASSLVQRLAAKNPVVFTLFASPYAIKSWVPHLGKETLHAIAFENCAEAGRATAIKYFQGTTSNQKRPPIVRPTRRGEIKGLPEQKTKGSTKQASSTETTPTAPPKSATTKQQQSKGNYSSARGKFAELDNIALEGIRTGAYPGCQIAVIYKGNLVYESAFGSMEGSKDSPAITPTTLYDIASITKAVATTPAIMKLVDMGKLLLSDLVEKHLPTLKGTPAGNISIKELLLHESGLPAGINFYEKLIAPQSLPDGKFFYYRGGPRLQKIDRQVWVPKDFSFEERFLSDRKGAGFSQPFADNLYISNNFYENVLEMIGKARLKKGKASRYSDVGFILLGLIAEKAAGMPMQQFLEQHIYSPMGLQHLFFHPLEHVRKEQIAPTQANNFMRGKVWGLVDDESAACLGGVAGNAGVFASATEVAKIGILLMDKGRWGDQQLINAKTVLLFRSTKSRDGKRTLGFMQKYKDNPNLPELASEGTFGHTGFTGTCLWIDPKKDLVFVFLSNRTFPSRLNNKLASEKLRPRLMEALYKAL